MIWLTIYMDAFGGNRPGLAGYHNLLSDLRYLPVLETDAVYRVAHPRVDG
jgi:hypothetical protein